MNAPSKIEAAAPAVYSAITAVMAHMANVGIAKDRKNEQQRYRFRGIDDIYNALASVLSANRLVMLPFVQDMQREERATKAGGALNYTILTVDFTLVSADDGSQCVIRMIGEAMDSADKSANKAMSAALKYAALQVFMIPTEGDNDADATTHEVASHGGFISGHNGGRAASQAEPTNTLRDQLEQSVEQETWKPRQNWGGRYPNKTALREGRTIHHAELERLGTQSTFNDLDAYLTSPEYVDYVKTALEHFPLWLEGDIPPELQEQMPPEYIQTFKLEQKARDMIALRGNVAADPVDG